MDSLPRVVYDCNIFWRAVYSATNRGSIAACIDLIRERRVLHFLSYETLTEIQDVLTRPESLKQFSTVSRREVDLFLVGIAEQSAVVKKVPRIFKFPRDPKDEPYIELASFVDADCLVTLDRIVST